MFERVIQTVLSWARAQPGIAAVALVGSRARGTARVDSDIDLVLLVADPGVFRDNTEWVGAAIGGRPLRSQDEDYGTLWSRRVWLEGDGGEIEFGFATAEWAALDPVDAGTRRVVTGGCRILHDPNGMLGRLCAAVGVANT